jgi:hypothetical protein
MTKRFLSETTRACRYAIVSYVWMGNAVVMLPADFQDDGIEFMEVARRIDISHGVE